MALTVFWLLSLGIQTQGKNSPQRNSLKGGKRGEKYRTSFFRAVSIVSVSAIPMSPLSVALDASN